MAKAKVKSVDAKHLINLTASTNTSNNNKNNKTSKVTTSNNAVEELNLDNSNTQESSVSSAIKAAVTDAFKYLHNKDKGVVQGYTMTDKYHVMIQTDEEKHKARLVLIDKETGEGITMDMDEDFGHGNDLEYNPAKNEIVVPYKSSKTGNDVLKIIKLNEKNEDGTFKTQTKKLEFRVGAIAYDANEDAYYVTSMPRGEGNKGVIRKLDANTLEMDDKFGEVKYKGAFDFSKDNYTTQGMTIKNDKIYYVATNKDTWDNYIVEYDKKGNMTSKIKIPFKEGQGELESIKFDENGQLYGNFISKNKGNLIDGKSRKHIKVAKIDIKNSTPPSTGGSTTLNA